MSTIRIFSVLTILMLVGSDPIICQTKPLPVSVSCRKSFLQGSYVLQIQNASNDELQLWLQAKGKVTKFNLGPGRTEEFGWAQGYRFDANNLFVIGAEGYETLRQRTPNVELNPVKIDFSNDGGLLISLSQSYLQERLPKFINLPITQRASNSFEISLNQIPQVILKDESERVFAEATLQASVLSGKLRFPLAATVSFMPSYSAPTAEIVATQIKVENIDLNVPNSNIGILPPDWRKQATQTINNILPALFDKIVLYKIEKKWQKNIANAANPRAKVVEGRLEITIF